MAERTVVVASRVGLHARPAMLFTQVVAAGGGAVTIARPGQEPVDASSILLVMSMGVKNGAEVVLAGEDTALLDRLVEMLETDLDAE
ncbi:HPr family phosphocarrier protein [Cellulomonas sp. KRMCY2]|uniref:HPr family phosphocarrier protein n=1 Tax=Cellulomonas sp. KRMCY2 TaxID=1304865 RepID=UPI00045E7D38|nr:HPr family phosphocarrier protein [Cellulomonas sp. KRMCY2]